METPEQRAERVVKETFPLHLLDSGEVSSEDIRLLASEFRAAVTEATARILGITWESSETRQYDAHELDYATLLVRCRVQQIEIERLCAAQAVAAEVRARVVEALGPRAAEGNRSPEDLVRELREERDRATVRLARLENELLLVARTEPEIAGEMSCTHMLRVCVDRARELLPDWRVRCTYP